MGAVVVSPTAAALSQVRRELSAKFVGGYESRIDADRRAGAIEDENRGEAQDAVSTGELGPLLYIHLQELYRARQLAFQFDQGRLLGVNAGGARGRTEDQEPRSSMNESFRRFGGSSPGIACPPQGSHACQLPCTQGRDQYGHGHDCPDGQIRFHDSLL